jgi:large subunit ribosomal protein L24
LPKGGVKKPNKNRKRMFTAPKHIKGRYISAPLSPSLKGQYGARSMPLRRDDTVTITKGARKLMEGKILRVDRDRRWIYIEGVTRTRMDGSTVQIPIRPENVMITRLSLEDTERRKIINHRGFEKGGGN